MTPTPDFNDLTPPDDLVAEWSKSTRDHRSLAQSLAYRAARWGARHGYPIGKQEWPEPDDDSDEVWRPIPGYEKHYSVSSHGRIRSEARYITTSKGSRIVYEKILKQSPAKNDYLRVTLAKDGNHADVYTHQAVALAFFGPRPDGMHVLHGPLGKQCNLAGNLYYGTPSQNHGPDRLRDGTDIRGTKHGNNVLTDDDVRAIRASDETQVALAKKYGVGRTTIRHIQARENWAWLDSEPRSEPTLQEQALGSLRAVLNDSSQVFRTEVFDVLRLALSALEASAKGEGK